jgi:hypothetical protein
MGAASNQSITQQGIPKLPVFTFQTSRAVAHAGIESPGPPHVPALPPISH